ncbi:MAG: DUF2490 domain-containing protein [Bacteroidales bacterium]
MGLQAVPMRIFFAMLSGLLLCGTIQAQVKDAGLWTSFSIETKLSKKISAGLTQELRFNENISEIGTAFTEAGLSYKLNKHFQIAANYRFTQKHRTDDNYNLKHRLYVDIKYNKKVKPLQFTFRSRFQDEFSNPGHSPDAAIAEFYLRNKLNMEWDLDKPFAPYISVELFSPLSYPREFLFDNIRSSAGIEYSLTKKQKFDIYYMIQKELNVSLPEIDFIIGIGYSLKL